MVNNNRGGSGRRRGKPGGFADKFNLIYAVSIIVVALFMLAVLVFELGKGVLSSKFIIIYLSAGSIGVVGFAIFIMYDYFAKRNRSQNVLADIGFVSEHDAKRRILSVVRFVLPIIFAVLVVVTSVGLKSQVVPVPIPYAEAATLGVDASLAAHSTVENILWMSVYPGLFEEMITFIIVTLLVGVLTLVWRYGFRKKDAFRDPIVLLVNVPIASAVGALLFSFAHKLAYGTNTQLFVSAWVFEFLAQMINQFTGFFASWIPHMVHNAVVSAGLLVGLSIGGYILAGGLALPTKWLKTKMIGGK